MRHRAGGSSKIKYEHHMIEGLRDFLEQIEEWEEIESIFPAVIERASIKQKETFSFKVRYPTPTGVKCLAKCRTAVQEVFIVTKNPEAFRRRLEAFRPKP